MTGYSEYEETHRHQHTEQEQGYCILQGRAIARQSRIQAQPVTVKTSTLLLACTVSCTGHRAVFQKLQFIKCEKSVSLNHCTALAGQTVCLTEKGQESSSLKSTGENELGFIGLRLIWQTEIATRCDLALV